MSSTRTLKVAYRLKLLGINYVFYYTMNKSLHKYIIFCLNLCHSYKFVFFHMHFLCHQIRSIDFSFHLMCKGFMCQKYISLCKQHFGGFLQWWIQSKNRFLFSLLVYVYIKLTIAKTRK